MQWLNEVLAQRRNSDTPLVEVAAVPGGQPLAWSYAAVLDAAVALAWELRAMEDGGARTQRLRVGLVATNGVDWVVGDLACLLAGAVQVPVPLGFSAQQASGLLRQVDLCIADRAGAARVQQWGPTTVLPAGTPVKQVDVQSLVAAGHGVAPPELPAEDWICKVVHTSGTTSNPKGVQIRAEGLSALLKSLFKHVPDRSWERYLSLVPLSLLIEQVTAVYLPVMGGGTVAFLPADVPLLGTAADAVSKILPVIQVSRPTTLMGPPVLFEAFAAVAQEHPDDSPQQLSERLFGTTEPAFLACGGAPVSAAVLELLFDRGIPVFEGYGLSENSSVVCWNTPNGYKLGSVGKPLDHVTVRVAEDGELLVKSTSLFAGYTTDDPSSCHLDDDGWLYTGDIAEVDEDGYVHVRGRKKNIIITSSGRNVAPDWVASRYQALPQVANAVVFGNHSDGVVGFFVLADGYGDAEARAAINDFGAVNLSEAEQVRWIHTIASDDPRLGELFTITGRPMRERIWALISGTGQESLAS